jgi:predicted dehydrogenase
VRLLIVGTGGMAAHARFGAIPGVSSWRPSTRSPTAQAFNATHGIPQGFASCEEALAWGRVRRR